LKKVGPEGARGRQRNSGLQESQERIGKIKKMMPSGNYKGEAGEVGTTIKPNSQTIEKKR